MKTTKRKTGYSDWKNYMSVTKQKLIYLMRVSSCAHKYFQKLRNWRKMGSKVPADAGFVCNEEPTTAVVLRGMISGMYCITQ